MNRYATKHEILALCESKEWNAAYKTYILALNSNEKISPDTYELVSNACLQLGTWREANEVLTSCPKPSIRLMGNVIECCCHTAAGEVEMRIALDVLERCVAEYVNMSQKLRGKKQNFDAMKRSLGSVLIAACRTRDDKKDREKKKKLHEFVPGGMERVVFGEPARTEAEAQVNVISTSLERLGVNDRHFLTYSATRDLFRGKSQNGNLSSLIRKIESANPSKVLSPRETLIQYCKLQNQREPRFSFERVSEREVRCRLMFPSGPLSRTLSMENECNDDDDDDDEKKIFDDGLMREQKKEEKENVNLRRAIKTMYTLILDLEDRSRFAKRFVPSSYVINEMLRASVRSVRDICFRARYLRRK